MSPSDRIEVLCSKILACEALLNKQVNESVKAPESHVKLANHTDCHDFTAQSFGGLKVYALQKPRVHVT